MPIVQADLVLVLPSVVATSFSTANIGGAKTTTEITGGSIGEVLFTMPANAGSGGTKTQYGKLFYKNKHATLPLTSAKIWMANACDQGASGYVTQAVSSNASDNSTKKLRVIANDNAGSPAPAQDEIQMNGTTTVTGSIQMTTRCVAELRENNSGSALTPAAGDISIIVNGVTVGIIPAGAYSCVFEIDAGLQNALDDTATTSNAQTAPAGITFTRPRNEAGGLAVANSGSLTAGSGQGIWLRWQSLQDRKPSSDVEIHLTIKGDTAA